MFFAFLTITLYIIPLNLPHGGKPGKSRGKKTQIRTKIVQNVMYSVNTIKNSRFFLNLFLLQQTRTDFVPKEARSRLWASN